MQILFEFGKMLRISQTTLAAAVSSMGLSKTVLVADTIAGKPDQILNPDGYLMRIVGSTYRKELAVANF